jgi:peptide/nickel transport system substrate-binding protein
MQKQERHSGRTVRGGRMMRTVCIVAVAIVTAAVAAGCGSSKSSQAGSGGATAQASFYTGGTPGGTPVRGGTVVVDSAEAPASLDPLLSVTPGDDRPSTAIFDTLIEFMPGSKQVQPALAKSWEISPSATTFTFHIRPGVRFSNGEPLTGKDVVYSLSRVKNLSNSVCRYLTTEWKSITLTGPMTVQMQLGKPDPSLVEQINVPCFGIVPEKVLRSESEQQFAQHPVGTGPFTLKSTNAGNTTVALVRNPDFWRGGGQPYLNELVFNQVESDNARILAVRSGTATLDIGVPYSQVSALRSTPGVRMVIQPLWGASIEPVNDVKAPLNETNVRRALAYVTPTNAIIKSVYKGYAVQANSIVGVMEYWDAKVPSFTYDVAKAKELLKTTSVPHGFSTTILAPAGDSSDELIATILQSAWAKIGVHVDVHTVDPTTLNDDLFAGKYDVVIVPPEEFVNEDYNSILPDEAYLIGASLPTEQPSSQLKAHLLTALTTLSGATREKLAQEIQREASWEEPFYLPMINLSELNLASTSLRGYQVLLNAHTRFEQVWLAH